MFVDDELPDFIRENVGRQLRQVQAVPRKSTDYTAAQRAAFPRLLQRPADHVLDWEDTPPPIERYPPRA